MCARSLDICLTPAAATALPSAALKVDRSQEFSHLMKQVLLTIGRLCRH